MISACPAGEQLNVKLGAELTIYQVGELHTAAQPWLAQPCQWVLDLSQVTEVDGAGLQWLLYLHQHLRRAGHGLVISHASPAVSELLQWCPNTGLALAA
ncbi:STAS domain-containing protein [Pseudomonas typographi]|uniref:STAS domain-containing protein n=1 Tax=Pseudomonas typographi TaxID=2715964 RepID=A0ABR7YYH3_9PSED|nr:STAS domain-containing protein [Pseudomonas typographi]MBD1550755.1 STAS domain-containing protein [Pseudomonas typographi]MBD1587697.1 STAS domain-containing protein [Pseudomonas typographi]MBD1598220.1 STAS domain-containing protein [Pseudomonas typographi]